MSLFSTYIGCLGICSKEYQLLTVESCLHPFSLQPYILMWDVLHVGVFVMVSYVAAFSRASKPIL